VSIDHVRVTGALLVVTFLYQFASFARTHSLTTGGRAKELAPRLFLFETTIGYLSWFVAGILLLARQTAIFHATGIVFGKAPAPRGLGLVLFVIANVLLVWTRRSLGKNLQLAGLPPKDGDTLVTHGPYRFVRHPLYLVSILLGPSLAMMVGSWLFVIPTAAIIATLPSLIALEEARVTAAYGDAYREYARRTRRIIPWVWCALLAVGGLSVAVPPALAQSTSGPVVAASAPAPARSAPAPEPALDDVARAELRRLIETRGFTRGLPTKAMPSPDGKRVYFLESGPTDRYQKLFVFDVKTGRTRVFLDPDALGGGGAISKEEQARRERQRQTERGITAFEISRDSRALLVPYSGDLFLVDAKSGVPTRLTDTPQPEIDARLSPDGKRVAFVRSGDLVAFEIASNRELVVAASDEPAVEYGVAEFIAQEEMGRFSGYWWSPDSRRIAFAQVDSRGIPTFRVPDFSDPTGEGSVSAYPKAGDPNAKVLIVQAALSFERLVEGGQIAPTLTWLGFFSFNADLEYIARVTWAPDGKSLWVETQPRSQKRLELRRVDLETGERRIILAESDSDWVNIIDEPRFLRGGESFVWLSERTGHRHIEVIGADGKIERALTSGAWDVTEIVDVDERRGEITFAATKDGVTERHLFRVGLDGGEVRGISDRAGWHAAAFNPHGHDLYAETIEDERTPPRAIVRRRDGARVGELPSAALAPPATDASPAAEFFQALTPDGVSLDLRVVRPPAEAGAIARRPLIVYVYGGPHAQQVQRRWPGERGLLDAWLARRGFVVARIDGRGVVARGHDSERIFAGRLGDEELDDQVAGVRALCERYPEIDPARVGIWGWSYGGYMTLMAMLRAPDIFRAGVSVAPVVDWRGYDTHYTERYLGLPSENAAGYNPSSVLPFVDGLRGHLTLVHGTGDDNVHFRESMLLTRALVNAGKRFDLMAYPGTHMMETIEERTHLYELIWKTFAERL